jgi:hypothetical protein
VTKSDLEALFLGLCKDNGLPAPRVNPTVAGKDVDFLFLFDDRLVVETDSWRYHKTRQAFENDRARDARLARAGYRTLRFTDRQLEREPRMVVATVRSHLTRPEHDLVPATAQRPPDPLLRRLVAARGVDEPDDREPRGAERPALQDPRLVSMDAVRGWSSRVASVAG